MSFLFAFSWEELPSLDTAGVWAKSIEKGFEQIFISWGQNLVMQYNLNKRCKYSKKNNWDYH